MMFYRIKVIFLSILIVCSCSFILHAKVQMEELHGNLIDAVGAEKTLPFVSWGSVPFDNLILMTKQLSEQKQSAYLAKMTADVLKQQTFIQQTSWTKEQSEKWLLTRLQSLLNLGYAHDVLAIIEKLPATALNVPILKIKLDAYFLTEQWQNACSLADSYTVKDAYFNHAQMLCLGLLGNRDKALMAFGLWQESYPLDKTTAFVMGKLVGLDLPSPEKMENLTVADVFVLRQLQAKDLLDVGLPLPYQKLTPRTYTDFGQAVNTQLLFDRWKQTGLSDNQQAYRYYLLYTYANMFLPELRFVKNKFLWEKTAEKMNFSLQAVLLKDKPETEITGSDLLLSLWLLKEQSLGIQNALIVLSKGGIDVKNFVLEQINL